MDEEFLKKHFQKGCEWINQINESMDNGKNLYAFAALQTVLHQIRDNLPLLEAIHLGGQLPLFVRGIYFEGWHPSEQTPTEKPKELCMELLRKELEKYMKKSDADVSTKKGINAAFETLVFHLNEEELNKLCALLPSGLRDLVAEARGAVEQLPVIM